MVRWFLPHCVDRAAPGCVGDRRLWCRAFAALAATIAGCSSPSDQHLGTVLADSPVLDSPEAGTSDASACVSQPVAAVEPALAMYILLDRSAAMRSADLGTDKWNAVTSGLGNYIAQAPATLEMGLGYFPADAHDNCACNNMPRCPCRDQRVLCNPASYDPKVPIAPLTAPQPDRLKTSLESNTPGVWGPIAPSMLQSEVTLRTWQSAQPHKKVVRVIITGGAPLTADSCAFDAGVSDVVALAGQSDFRTYVVAVSTDPNPLDKLAAAGGTRASIPFDIQQDPVPSMRNILNQIVSAEKGCDFIVPAADAATLRPSVADGQSPDSYDLTQFDTRQSCINRLGGWYRSADRLSLCDATCRFIHGQSWSSSVVTRCERQTPTR